MDPFWMRQSGPRQPFEVTTIAPTEIGEMCEYRVPVLPDDFSPDKCLDRLLMLSAEIGTASNHPSVKFDTGRREAALLMLQLHTWIRQGGYLPAKWVYDLNGKPKFRTY